jgi:endonuclease YncB( thermonuclease family)
MRFWPVALAAIALAGIVAGGVVVSYRPPASPPPAAVDALAPLSSPTPSTPPPIAAVSPPRLAAAPDLPTVEVSPRPEHVVPDEDSAPPRPVTFQDRDRGGDVAPRVAAREPPSLPPRPPAAVISGKARLGEGVSLIVEGRAVVLFGMRAPQQGDRCTVSARLEARPCSEVARDALASRLGVDGRVSCHVPPGRSGDGRSAICLDSTGVDLGGFLVAQGLGLADAAQSRDYVGAESAAASLHRGLWRFR